MTGSWYQAVANVGGLITSPGTCEGKVQRNFDNTQRDLPQLVQSTYDHRLFYNRFHIERR